MTEFTVHTRESAPEASKPIIDKVKASVGMLPNLMATLALRVLSNYSNHFTHAPVDKPFQSFAWSPDDAAAT